MAYDEGLAQRVREYFRDRKDIEEKRMFGGLCFMVSGHMCCGIVDDKLMARVGPENYESCLKKNHANEMNFTGRPMRGFIYVAPGGITVDSDLTGWINICMKFVESLPPK